MMKIIFISLLLILFFGCTGHIQNTVEETPEVVEEVKVEEPPEFIEEVDVVVAKSKPDLSSDISALRQELGVIRKDNLILGKEHYERIKKRLIAIEKEGYGVQDDVQELKDMLTAAYQKEQEFKQETRDEESRQEASKPDCEGGRITLNHPPFDLKKIIFITPLGQMSGSHVTPVDHQYYTGRGKVNVYAPADGIITFVQHMTSSVSDPGDERFVDDYVITIKHTCTMESHFIHVDDPIAEIVERVGDEEYKYIYLNVKEGQLIGTFEDTVDFNIFDKEVKNYFANPKSYEDNQYELVKDPFDYFNSDIRSELRAKSLRVAEPVGGKIDYDIDGKLVGTWFEEGTNGHQGVEKGRYWAGHLSLAYNHIDPSLITISTGTFQGRSHQFAVKGNSPDPTEVDKNSGIVKYELVNWDYHHDGQHWDRESLAKPITAKQAHEEYRVALFQMLENGKLKAEFFPDKTANGVKRFSEDARVYVR